MIRLTLACLLMAACGGDAPEKPIPFGWWNGSNTSGSMSFAVPSEYPQAVANGKQAVVMIWPVVWDGPKLKPGWLQNLRELLAATPRAVGYYVIDEYTGLGISVGDMDRVVAELPSDKIIMQSLSWEEIARKQYVPQAVNLLGVNMYSSSGATPEKAVAALDKLSEYGRPMYLNLDAVRFPRPAGGCQAVTEADQMQSLALNDAIVAWGRGRDVRAYVAFIWQSLFDSVHHLCGAEELPLIRAYMARLQ